MPVRHRPCSTLLLINFLILGTEPTRLVYNFTFIFSLLFTSRIRLVWLLGGTFSASGTRGSLLRRNDERGEWRTWTRARFSFVVISVAISLRPRFGECRDARDGAALIRRYRGSAAEARSERGGHG